VTDTAPNELRDEAHATSVAQRLLNAVQAKRYGCAIQPLRRGQTSQQEPHSAASTTSKLSRSPGPTVWYASAQQQPTTTTVAQLLCLRETMAAVPLKATATAAETKGREEESAAAGNSSPETRQGRRHQRRRDNATASVPVSGGGGQSAADSPYGDSRSTRLGPDSGLPPGLPDFG
jgi:hypothetical protein